MEAVKRKLILFVMRSRPYQWFLRWVLPHIRLSTRLPQVNGRSFMSGYSVLQPADYIFTYTENKLTSKLIPGPVDHVAFCVAKGGPFEAVEMIASGFNKCHFFDLCHESDRIIIARAPKWDHEYRRLVIAHALALEFKVKGYDQFFDDETDEFLYCSELAAVIDFGQTLRLDRTDFLGLGRKYISPMGFLCSYDLIVVFDSWGELEGLTGDQVEWKFNSKRKA